MKAIKTGNNQYLKELNKAIIMDLIRTSEGISRKALADKTGLSATATGTIVSSLLDDEYIQEKGLGKSSGGRKPVILELKPRSYFAFGFDIDSHCLYTIVMDITGDVIYKRKRENQNDFTPQQAIKTITKEYTKAVTKLKLSEDKILGVGVSVPGILDIVSKKIILAPNLGWSMVELLEPLKSALDIPVYLDNESMCSASCENWLGLCKDVEDFICINIESGIGSGLFLRGKAYRGISGSAGEVGHIPVNESGPVCKCGNVGCLETIASINGMVARANKSKKNNHDIGKTFNELLKNAREGDEECLRVLKEGAVSLGKAIAYLINTINPQKIVLGKRFPDYSELVIDVIRKTAKKYALTYPASQSVIIPSSFGEDSSALGAAIIPIRKLFGR